MQAENLPSLCLVAATLAMLPFMVAGLISYRRQQLLLTQKRNFYKGRPRKQRHSRWQQPDFLTYNIRRLRPKLNRLKLALPLFIFFIKNLFSNEA